MALVQSGQQVQELIMLVVGLVVVTLREVHIQQEPGAMGAAGMEGIVLSNQQVVTQHPAQVAVAALETIWVVLQKAARVVLAS